MELWNYYQVLMLQKIFKLLNSLNMDVESILQRQKYTYIEYYPQIILYRHVNGWLKRNVKMFLKKNAMLSMMKSKNSYIVLKIVHLYYFFKNAPKGWGFIKDKVSVLVIQDINFLNHRQSGFQMRSNLMSPKKISQKSFKPG